MGYEISLFFVALAAGCVAAISGFGIGSLLTPLLVLSLPTRLAVVLVSVPHFIATTLRFLMMKQHVDRRALLSFGIMSAAGGLTGALLHHVFETQLLTLIFSVLLLFAGFMGLSGLGQKMRFQGPFAWIAGALSGFLGGLVGNQGGIRSAAMLGFRVSKESFVATATAIGVIVDLVRMPVYLWFDGATILSHGRFTLVMCVGVVIGTLIGSKVLRIIPEALFRRTVSALILCLGVFMLNKSF
jgi:uncharacterized membrane protein YfcA